ncbi:MAG: hypothetical protein ABI135_02945 [Rhodoferax sp.]
MDDPKSQKQSLSASNVAEPGSHRPLPAGYRQGIVTAITVFIGFSLAFLRFWAFEAPGDWTPRSVMATIAICVPIAMEIYALFRALRVADDDETEYAKTVRWFITSIVVMLVAVFISAAVLSDA